MKLYFAPGTCSLSPHIVAREAGIDLELIRVDIRATPHRTADGTDFTGINPKGYVPVLELEDGARLTEGTAIVQYLADLAPATGLAPAAGSRDRYRLEEWLTFIATELHKTFSPWLFHPEYGEQAIAVARQRLAGRFDLVERHLAAQPYLLGDRFTVADAYAFTVIGWARLVKIDLAPFPGLNDYLNRIAARPAVRAALQAEATV